jgi:release factor glutamine methyltransferase
LTIIDAILYGQKKLTSAGIKSPRLDSELILCHVLKTTRTSLYINHKATLNQIQQKNYKKLLKVRCKHVPVAYIIRKKEFYGLEFFIRQGILIPRPETELLVEKTLEVIKNKDDPCVADLCCGCGSIAVAVAYYNKSVNVFASDLSKLAVSVAAKNVIRHKVENRVFLMCGDLWRPFDAKNIKGFDVVVSNPPYIPSRELKNLKQDVKREPILALDGGNDGLDFYRKIINETGKFLKTSGSIILEIGWDQAVKIHGMLKDAGFSDIQVIKDYAGFDRVVSAVWNNRTSKEAKNDG